MTSEETMLARHSLPSAKVSLTNQASPQDAPLGNVEMIALESQKIRKVFDPYGIMLYEGKIANDWTGWTS